MLEFPLASVPVIPSQFPKTSFLFFLQALSFIRQQKQDDWDEPQPSKDLKHSEQASCEERGPELFSSNSLTKT